MSVSYVKTVWQDAPSTATPITAARLNKIEQGIFDCANELNNGGSSRQLLGIFRDAQTAQYCYSVYKSSIKIPDSIRDNLYDFQDNNPDNTQSFYELSGWVTPNQIDNDGRTISVSHMSFPVDVFGTDIDSGLSFTSSGEGTWRSRQGYCFVTNTYGDSWADSIVDIAGMPPEQYTPAEDAFRVFTLIDAVELRPTAWDIRWILKASMPDYTPDIRKVVTSDLSQMRIHFTIYLEKPLINGLG